MMRREWAKKLGVSKRVITKMGGAGKLNAMTELGRGLYCAVWFGQVEAAAVRAAVLRIGRECTAQAHAKSEREHLLQRRSAILLRRMTGITHDLVWTSGAPMKQPPIWLREVRRDETAERMMQLAARRKAS